MTSGGSSALQAPNPDDWKIYSSPQYGFEIRYPPDWSFNDRYENNYGKTPSPNGVSGYAGETRILFSLEKEGADQPDEGGGDFEDGAIVVVKITGVSGKVESWNLPKPNLWSLVSSTPGEWVDLQSSPFAGKHLEQVSVTTNGFVGRIEVAYQDEDPEKIWGESGGAYRVLPGGRVLLISWERMNVANSLSYQACFLPMLSSFRLLC